MTLATSTGNSPRGRAIRTARKLLGTSALSLPFLLVPIAHAQQQQTQQPGQQQQTQQQQAQQQGEACRELQAMLEDDDAARVDIEELRRIVNQGDDNRCVVVLERVTEAGGIQAIETDEEVRQIVAEAEQIERREVDAAATVSETATVTETVEIERQALVEGEVVVRVPNPEVAVTQGAPEIDVLQPAPEVRVEQRQAEILVRQAPQRVRIEMAAPTIIIEQDAPEIIVTMPDPTVNVASAEPQVEVRMSEPQVRVEQADPEIAMNLEARVVSPEEARRVIDERGEEGVMARTERAEQVDGQQAQVTMETAAAVVNQPTERPQPNVEIVQAEPTVRFEAAEPQLEFTMTGEPEVQVQQVGEPRVTIQQAELDDEDREPQPARQFQPDEAEPDQRAAAAPAEANDQERAVMEQPADREADARPVDTRDDAETVAVDEPVDREDDTVAVTTTGADAPRETVTAAPLPSPDFPGAEPAPVLVGEIVGLDVYNMNNVELGEVDRVVTDGRENFLVVERGGFLGIGRSAYALPLDRVVLSGGRIMLEGLTEDEFQALPEYDATNEVELSGAEQVEVQTRS